MSSVFESATFRSLCLSILSYRSFSNRFMRYSMCSILLSYSSDSENNCFLADRTLTSTCFILLSLG